MKNQINEIVNNSNGETLKLEVKRNNETIFINIKPIKQENRYYLGINFGAIESNVKDNLYYGYIETMRFYEIFTTRH